MLRLFNRLLIYVAPRHRVKTYFGAQFDCNVRDLVGATIFHFRTWEPNASRVFAEIITPGDLVVDLGANIGYFSILFSRLVGESGEVIAVEALPRVAATLAENVLRNASRNVKIVNAAVGGERGTARTYEGPSTNLGASTIRSDRGFPAGEFVELIPLDEILSPEECKRVSLIKIDIEGAEIPVLRRLIRTLDLYSQNLSIAVEANVQQNSEWTEIFAEFRNRGFDAYDLANNVTWVNMLDRGISSIGRLEILPNVEQVDVLFTRSRTFDAPGANSN